MNSMEKAKDTFDAKDMKVTRIGTYTCVFE